MTSDSEVKAPTPTTPAAITSLEAAGVSPVPVQEKEKMEEAASRDDDGSERYGTSPAPTTEAGRDRDPGQEKSGEENVEYITGFKLLAVMIAVVLAAFLMLLDISIISTVRVAPRVVWRRCPRERRPSF